MREYESELRDEGKKLIKIQNLPWGSLLSRGISVGANVVLAFFYLKLFGAADAGWYFLAFTIVTIVSMAARMGTENEALRVFPGLFEQARFGEMFADLRWLHKVVVRATLTVGTLFFLSALFSYQTWKNDLSIHLMILAITVPLSGYYVLIGTVLRSMKYVPMGTLLETGLAQLLAMILVGVAAVIGVLTPFVMSFALLISSGFCAAIAWMYFRFRTKQLEQVQTIPKFQSTLKWSQDGSRLAFLMASGVLHNALISSPILFLGAFSTSQQIAYYNAAARFASLIAVVPTFQSPHLLPQVSALLHSGKTVAATLKLSSAARFATVVGILIALGATVLTSLPLVGGGESSVNVTILMAVLVWGNVLQIALGQVNPVMGIAGLGGYSTVGVAAVSALAIVPYIFAAQAYGAVGAAIVFILAISAYACFGNVVLARKTKLTAHCFRISAK